ncbi:MAG: tRNA 2-selenouridine(34) synthase MnmH [Gammaproteobacteria bacterium]|nr:tRNA 2-selenouridine(34) synthase MnmH [Gammaproteobacteria bacterium]
MQRLGPGDFDRLLLAQRPLLDVRAPVEFCRGSIPGAVNLPLLEDEERHQVGIRYRQAGQEAAISLGHELVSGTVREQRITAWSAFVDARPDAVLYCFRGGLRSRIAHDWIAECGRRIPVVEGGYKALRRHLLAQLERLGSELPLLVIGGRTGTGKTRLLDRLARSIDLEGLARHRGSAFGPRVDPQPAPIDFENRLALRLMQLEASATAAPVAIEDESRNVGRLSVPPALLASMAGAPLMLLEASVEERVRVTLEDYVIAGRREHEARFGEDEGFRAFSDYLLGALGRVRRRLGGARHAEIEASMREALELQERTGDPSGHEHWIRRMLVEYYDPMYDHQLSGKLDRVIARGDMDELEARIRTLQD